MYFEKQTIDLGAIPENKKQHVIFELKKDVEVPEIKRISTSCGCTSARVDRNKKILTVDFNAGSLPIHLVKQGYYKTSKTITVEYEDNKKEVLTLLATVQGK